MAQSQLTSHAGGLLAVQRVTPYQKGANHQRHRWSAKVTERSDALDLKEGVFKLEEPRAIAKSLKASAERSHRRKASPFQSAMSMLTFYINRAGDQLTDEHRQVLEKAKGELRELYGRKPSKPH